MRNSDEKTIGKTHPTLDQSKNSLSKNFQKFWSFSAAVFSKMIPRSTGNVADKDEPSEKCVNNISAHLRVLKEAWVAIFQNRRFVKTSFFVKNA